MSSMVMSTGAVKTQTTHPTPGMLHQMTNTPFLMTKLKPVTEGDLKISVRLLTGQTSTVCIASTATVGDLKHKLVEDCGAQALGLMYLGKVLTDPTTLGANLVADRSTLTQIINTGRLGKSEAANKATIEAIAAAKGKAGSHTDALRGRVDGEQAVGLDLDFEIPSWHKEYKPYSVYVPPKDGQAQAQAAAYEKHGNQAWRRDYKIDGAGCQAQVNNEKALRDAPEETE